MQIQKRSVLYRVTAVTIGYTDEAGKQQIAVIELGKDIVRTTREIVETRSAKQIEHFNHEARNSDR